MIDKINVPKILIFDPSIASTNLGDKIIYNAVYDELLSIFNNGYFLSTSTQEKIGVLTYNLNKSSSFSFVAGTNLLSSNMPWYNQWKINIIDSFFLDNIILLGVGWWQYQQKPNFYTNLVLNRILSRDIIHSVRDDYTKKMLESIGIKNVLNTGCPTMWQLTQDHCSDIPITKGKSVVFTLSDYNKDFEKDRKMIEILKYNYDFLFFWPQGIDDLNYFYTFNIEDITIISPQLNALDSLLSSKYSVDYIGTRLHAGIRALQHKKRTIIIAIDNRAIEISQDTNLPILIRTNIEGLSNLINSDLKTIININQRNIKLWKEQFSSKKFEAKNYL